jgi:hypothetical protein
VEAVEIIVKVVATMEMTVDQSESLTEVPTSPKTSVPNTTIVSSSLSLCKRLNHGMAVMAAAAVAEVVGWEEDEDPSVVAVVVEWVWETAFNKWAITTDLIKEDTMNTNRVVISCKYWCFALVGAL